MKLQPDLVREILIWCEQNLDDKDVVLASNIKIAGYSTDEIVYHVSLLVEADYIKFCDASGGQEINYLLKRLTLTGHQLLDTMRSPKHWNSVKKFMGEVGLQALPIILDFLKPQIIAYLGRNP